MRFQMIARSVMKWLDSLLIKLKGFGSDQFVTNVHAARKALAVALADYSATRGKPALLEDGSNAPAFSGANKDAVGNQGGRSAGDVAPGELQAQREKEAITHLELQESDPKSAHEALMRMYALDKRIRNLDPPKSEEQLESHRGEHEAPMRDSGAPLHNLKGVYPDDFYSAEGPRFYGVGDGSDARSMSIVRSLKGRPRDAVTVYRAVPKSVSARIGRGDWVTLDRK